MKRIKTRDSKKEELIIGGFKEMINRKVSENLRQRRKTLLPKEKGDLRRKINIKIIKLHMKRMKIMTRCAN